MHKGSCRSFFRVLPGHFLLRNRWSLPNAVPVWLSCAFYWRANPICFIGFLGFSSCIKERSIDPSVLAVGFCDCRIRGRMWPWCNSWIFWVGYLVHGYDFSQGFSLVDVRSLGSSDEEHEISSSNDSDVQNDLLSGRPRSTLYLIINKKSKKKLPSHMGTTILNFNELKTSQFG